MNRDSPARVLTHCLIDAIVAPSGAMGVASRSKDRTAVLATSDTWIYNPKVKDGQPANGASGQQFRNR